MAILPASRPVASTPAPRTVPTFDLGTVRLRLGAVHGLGLGFALGLGAWLPELLRMADTPQGFFYPTLLLSWLLLTLVGGIAGLLATWLRYALIGALIWAATGWLMTQILGRLLFQGQSWLVWLADHRFWGLPIYPMHEAVVLRMWLAGFFILLGLTLYGLLQGLRLDGLLVELTPGGRLSGQGRFLLIALLLPAALVGAIAGNILLTPVYAAPKLVDQAIRVARTVEADALFPLSLDSAINYSALGGVHHLLDGPYALQFGEIRLGAADEIIVLVSLENGAQIYCRVMAANLTNCLAQRAPYERGFPSLVSTGRTPPDCPACSIRVDAQQAQDLAARRARLGPDPRVTSLAQWGSHVLMQARAGDGAYAFRCFVVGISPVVLGPCQDVQ